MSEKNQVRICPAGADHDREVPEIDLLSPLRIRKVTFRNRIGMSPMCQYSAKEGYASDWHLVNVGSRAVGGDALSMVEATAVTKEGRISPGDLGIWEEGHIEMLARIAKFIESQGAVPGIQLAHAGRKASVDVPWKGGQRLSLNEGGWDTVAPSAIPFNESDPLPKELDEKEILSLLNDFKEGCKRALKAGFKVIEIHAAHGYLLHEFLSPLSNKRTDAYGGSLENRMRLVLQIAEEFRRLMGDQLALFVRISATDWVEKGWDIEEAIILAKHLKALGVDLIDVSTGGIVPKASIPVAKGYQVPFAKQIRENAGIKTAAVGLITDPLQANEIITGGDADFVFLGREFLREPYWALKAELELGAQSNWPLQYGYAVKRR